MSRAKNYRQAERPSEPKPRGVKVSRAEPPPDPELEHQKGRRDAGKLLAQQIAENARSGREEESRTRVFGWIVEAFFALFRG